MDKEIYFFSTCMIDLLYPKAGLSAMQLIRNEGIKVRFPKNQSCCGQPAYNSGYRTEALAVARSLIKCFKREIPIIVPSASCAGMIKYHWSKLFSGQYDKQLAINIASRTMELTQYLNQNLHIKLTDLGDPLEITVHSSCSALREMKVGDDIQALIAQLKNVTVLEHQRKTECCGFGGTFSIKQADISGAMVNDKIDNLQATGAKKVISQDCGCLMNIGGALDKQASSTNNNLKTQHIAEFLWERCHESD